MLETEIKPFLEVIQGQLPQEGGGDGIPQVPVGHFESPFSQYRDKHGGRVGQVRGLSFDGEGLASPHPGRIDNENHSPKRQLRSRFINILKGPKLKVPLFTQKENYLVAGKRPLTIAWEGGREPFSVSIITFPVLPFEETAPTLTILTLS